MRVNFVEITEAGQEAPELDRRTRYKTAVENERFFDGKLVVGTGRANEHAGKIRIDVGADRQFRFTQMEAASAGADLVAARNESTDPVSRRVSHQVAILPVENQRNRRIERIRNGACRRRCTLSERRGTEQHGENGRGQYKFRLFTESSGRFLAFFGPRP